METSQQAINSELSLDDKFERDIFRFSSSLSDLRELSELIESLMKKHKLRELEVALARYDGLGEALCHFDSKLKSDISLIQQACEESVEQFDTTLKFEVIDTEKGKKALTVAGDTDEIKEFDKSISTILKSDSNLQHMHKSSLISLVSVTEVFFSQLLHLFYQTHPAAVNAKDKQFTFEELSTFASIDDAKSYLVSWKIENIIRGSYEDWFDYLKNQLKLEMSGIVNHHEKLIENFQRRNLFVHNDGVVNKIYMAKVDKSLTKPEWLSNKLTVSKKYLFETIDRIESVFLQIAFEMWAKCNKTSEKRPTLIVHSAYDALQKKRWHVAAEVSNFIVKDKAANEATILMAKVNSWIARKKFEEKSLIQGEVNEFDVSAKDDLFKLAKYCLLEDNDSAIQLAKHLEKTKQISLSELLEWPLFEELRATSKMATWLEQLQKKVSKKPKVKAKNTKTESLAKGDDTKISSSAKDKPKKRNPK